MLLEEIREEMKVVVELSTSTNDRVGNLEFEVKKVNKKLDSIEANLVGKADSGFVDKLDHRVTRLEGRI